MTTYKLHNDPYTGEPCTIIRTRGDEVVNIPMDTDNRDYREYLKWLEEGNEPLPADSGE